MYKFYYTNGDGMTCRPLKAQQQTIRIHTWNLSRNKWLMRINLTCLILITTLLQVGLAAKAQRISLTEKNAPLTEVFKDIRKQCGFDFLINDEQIKQSKSITINVKNMELAEVLNRCFKDQPFNYSIAEKLIIVVSKKPEPAQTPVSADFPSKGDINIHGKVTDDTGNPLPGVTVSVKGTQERTATDKNGEFRIRINSPSDILVFTSIGMQPAEEKVGNRVEISLTMRASSTALSEVRINTGYQTLKKEQMTGSTVTVTSDQLEDRYQPNIINNLEGRVPGLVNYRGNTQIRGVSTIQANTAVLVVVDGLPMEGSVANLNPYDIESVTVLKDAAAAAIYGIRAANGVIVIETKKAKSNRTSVEFESNVTITQKPDISFHLLTPAQQVDLESNFFNYQYVTSNAAATNISKTTSDISTGNYITPVQYAYYQFAQGKITNAQLQAQLASYRQNDFRKQFSDNALLNDVLQQYNLAVRTGSDKYQSSLVVNYKTDNTGIINAYNNQLNLFYKGTYKLSKWMDVNFGVNTILGQSKASNSSFATSGTDVSPYLQLLDASGNRMYYTTSDYNMYNTNSSTMPRYSMLVNHLDELGEDASTTKQEYGRYFVNALVRVIPGLTFTPQFQYENNITNISAYSEADSYIMRYLKNVFNSGPGTTPGSYVDLLPDNGGKLATSNSTGNYWTARGQLDYKKQFGKHYIDVIAGAEFRQTETKGTNGLLLGYDDQLQSQATTSVNFPALYAFTPTTFKAGSSAQTLYNTYINSAIGVIPDVTHRFNSGYANATYTYDGRYNAFGSYRVDYADVFGLDEKFRGKPLWSTGLGWNISNEKFMYDITWVKFLKVRATYGITGNIPLGITSQLTANSTLTNPATNVPVSVVTNAANPDLRWEKTATTNIGLDFDLFEHRLTGSFDWYQKKGSDVFFAKLIDPSEGFTSQIINNADLVNNGVELGLNYAWFKATAKSGFGWTSSVVLSHNSNRVTHIDNISTTPLALVQSGYQVGYPVNSLFSFQYKGLNSVGQPQWLKADGTLTTVALTGSDMSAVKFSGGTDPKNNISFSNEFHYKGFSLNILAVYYGGQYLRAEAPSIYSGATYASMPSYLANSWTPTNRNTLIPGFGQYSPGTYAGTSAVPAYYLQYSDAFVRPGDFIKIRNAVLAYQLPFEWMGKLGLKSVRFSFQLNNPKALWEKNNIGIDPETGAAPIPTSYVFGISVNL